MIGLVIIVAITVLGMIFNDKEPVSDEAITPVVADEFVVEMETNSPSFFVLETFPDETKGSAKSSLIVKSTQMIALIVGSILLATLIVLVMLPNVSVSTKKKSMWWFVAGLIAICLGLLFSDGITGMQPANQHVNEIYVVVLVALVLFIFAGPLAHTELKDISHVIIVAISVLTLASVFFFTGHSVQEIGEPHKRQEIEYAAPILVKPEPVDMGKIEYAKPARVNVGAEGLNTYTQIAYISFLIVLLHLILWLTMRENTFKSFWPHASVVLGATLAWSALFYAIGAPLWKIAIVIMIAMLTAPIILHILRIVMKNQSRDIALHQWSG